MSEPPDFLPIDAGLLSRFRAAGTRIAWRPAPSGPRRPKGRSARIAHLNDEEARVEVWEKAGAAGFAADSGPLGALVLLLEVDRRGATATLGAWESGRDPAFPSGAVVATWGAERVPSDTTPRLRDLVELARYALA